MTIDSRIQDFMSLHKGDLSRFLAKAEAKLIELGHDVESIFADEPAPAPMTEPVELGPILDKIDGVAPPLLAQGNGTEAAPQ